MALFDSLDPNGNGMLSLAELDKGIVTSYPQFNNKPAIMAAYKASDRNGDGLIRRSEFGYFLRFIKYYNNLWHVFEGIDADGDRRISKDEFVAAKLDLGADDAAQTFDAMDENGGGMVLFDELCHWMATNKSDLAAGATEDEVFSTMGTLNP
jgi:Ca2+-binding EF-hand superfamily protein